MASFPFLSWSQLIGSVNYMRYPGDPLRLSGCTFPGHRRLDCHLPTGKISETCDFQKLHAVWSDRFFIFLVNILSAETGWSKFLPLGFVVSSDYCLVVFCPDNIKVRCSFRCGFRAGCTRFRRFQCGWGIGWRCFCCGLPRPGFKLDRLPGLIP